jgi:hypothetical protein
MLNEAEYFYVDLKARSLVVGEVRRRGLTRAFGVPGDEQSLLVTLILLGALATVAKEYASRLPKLPGLPDAADTEMAGGVLNAGLRGLAGPPAAAMPLAGLMIGFAVMLHGLRPLAQAFETAIPGAARRAGHVARRAHTSFRARYTSRPAPTR